MDDQGCAYRTVCIKANAACSKFSGAPDYECYEGPMCPRIKGSPKCIDGICDNCTVTIN